MKKDSKISEKLLEKKLAAAVRDFNGLCLKYHNSFDTGYPDRIVLMPGGKTYWVELKSTGDNLSRVQKYRMAKLTIRGHKVFIVDSLKSLAEFVKVMQV